MQQYRADEQGRPFPLRAERFYKLGDDWYFLVRGGTQFGPYRSRAEADQAVRQFFRPADAQPASGGVVHPFGSQRAKRWRDSRRF
jgi:hypothetical protein